MTNLPKKASDLFININNTKFDTFSDETVPLLNNYNKNNIKLYTGYSKCSNKNYGTLNKIYCNFTLENIKTSEILTYKCTCDKNVKLNSLINNNNNYNINNIISLLNNLVLYKNDLDYKLLYNNKSINLIPDGLYMLIRLKIFTNNNSIFKLNNKYHLIKKLNNNWTNILNPNKYLLNIIKNKNKTIKTITKQNLNFQNEIISNISNNYLIKTTLNNLNNLINYNTK